ncbi:MAG: FAD-dependent oxidoreductase [Paracoccaceae bacterium]|nr:FAD-dependent oxidoreductase [Paracoccaceae bacterium]
MTRQARVVVIGGGIAGCSTIYHLTREGWTDIVLLERDDLTSGTTWHSAAQVTNFGTLPTMIGLKSHSIRLYRKLAGDDRFPVDYHVEDGGIRLAGNQVHIDGYHHFASLAKGMGVEFEVIDAEECGRRHPLLDTRRLAGGLWDPLDGDVDPSQLCQSLARQARRSGAEILRETEVVGLAQKPDRSWVVETNREKIVCDIVVNAGGYRANEVAALMGTRLPMVSMEHQYLITEPIPEIAAAGRRMPLIRCPQSDFYCRQDRQGLLVGFYEQDCRSWGIDGIDPAFTRALCPTDFERILPVMAGAIDRIPVLKDVGIQSAINGPITYSADGLPLVGAVPGRLNAFVIAGLRAGIGEGGGHGWLLAELIVHGETSLDSWCLDPRRFGPHATIEFTARKAAEEYRNEFRFHVPGETRPAGRPARTTAVTPALEALGAEFTVVNGWERAEFFRPGQDISGRYGYRFDDLEDVVRSEVLNVHRNVGIQDVCGFSRFEFSGRGIREWLDRLTCSRIPQDEGRVSLCYFLNGQGHVKCEATLANLGSHFWYGSAAAAQVHDYDWLSETLPEDGSIRIRCLTSEFQIIVVAGPNARDVLQDAVQCDVSSQSLPWLGVRCFHIASVPVVVYALSYTGELAFEIHVPLAGHLAVWNSLCESGRNFGMAPFGLLATDSMRIEKGYRHWKADLSTEYDPIESGLERFVQWDKTFFGREALLKKIRAGRRHAFVAIALDCDIAPTQPGACILDSGAVVGVVTSAARGYRVGANLALGFIDPVFSEPGQSVAVEAIGRSWPARVVNLCQFDPDNRQVRELPHRLS